MKQEIDSSGSSLLHTYNLVGESLISVMGGRIVHCGIKRKEGKRFRRVGRQEGRLKMELLSASVRLFFHFALSQIFLHISWIILY